MSTWRVEKSRWEEVWSTAQECYRSQHPAMRALHESDTAAAESDELTLVSALLELGAVLGRRAEASVRLLDDDEHWLLLPQEQGELFETHAESWGCEALPEWSEDGAVEAECGRVRELVDERLRARRWLLAPLLTVEDVQDAAFRLVMPRISGRGTP